MKCNWINKLILAPISWLFGGIVLYLWLLAGNASAHITYSRRYTIYLVEDSVWRNLVVTILVTLAIYMLLFRCPVIKKLRERINSNSLCYLRRKRLLLFLTGLVCLGIALVFFREPVVDQKCMWDIAEQFLVGDYSAVDPGGYLNMYPFQIGLECLMVVCRFLFGTYGYVAIRVLNVLAVIVAIGSFADLTIAGGGTNSQALGVIISFSLFLPLQFYVTFVYGNLIGLAFATLFFKELVYFVKTRNTRHLSAACVFCFLTIFFKDIFLIYILTGILFFFIVAIGNKNEIFVRAAMHILITMLIAQLLPSLVMYAWTGQSESAGESKLAWVVMGLGECGYFCQIDGWYNGYSKQSYAESGYITEVQKERAWIDLKKRIQEIKEDPKSFVLYLSDKNASQWNNPDFQSVWLIKKMKTISGYWLNDLAEDLLSYSIQDFYTIIVNYYQFFILTGVLLGLILPRETNKVSILYMLILIGGFIFYTVWEAKCQYALLFFVLLIPMAVDGYRRLFTMNREKLRLLLPHIIVCLMIIIIVALAMWKVPYIRHIFSPDEDTLAWEALVQHR